MPITESGSLTPNNQYNPLHNTVFDYKVVTITVITCYTRDSTDFGKMPVVTASLLETFCSNAVLNLNNIEWH